MGHKTVRIGSALVLLLIIAGLSFAGNFDFNPDKEAVKYKNDVTSDVTGKGLFAQVLAKKIYNKEVPALAVPAYIRNAVLWSIGA